MVGLTREVRFTIPLPPVVVPPPLNGLAGNLVDGPGMFFVLTVTLCGEVDSQSQYIQNIKIIDARVLRDAVPAIAQLLGQGRFTLARATQQALQTLHAGWANADLVAVQLALNPYSHCSIRVEEPDMVQLTQRFEFSAAHRLHNASLDEVTNRGLFGKCNNPAGHGHNYEFEVTLAGTPDSAGKVANPTTFTQIVHDTIITRFDHKHLNSQTAEFAQTIPSVENIARVIYDLLKPRFAAPLQLASVRVWETPKTSAFYAE